jgi:cell fate (sporulation/competence/biofilm development) regulator YlbF (YheA/YmcA/DUF963 family)
MPTDEVAREGADAEVVVMSSARELAKALAASREFQTFDAAQWALIADRAVYERLQTFERRREEVRGASAWGGASAADQSALEEEWEPLSQMPVLRAFLVAQGELFAFLQDVGTVLSAEVGIDYGALAGSGGCCG